MTQHPTEPGHGRLIIIGALPPPVHGVTISTSLALANPLLRERFAVEHVDTSDHRPVSAMERWDTRNVTLGLRNVWDLVRRLRGSRGIVYLPLSEYYGAFLRDSLFIHAAALARWQVAVHIRSSRFRDFYNGWNPLARWWARVTLRRISGLAVLGSGLRSIFDGLVPADRIAVVPNGTPDVPLTPRLRDPDRVLYLSNLLRGKGVVEAVEAALIVTRRHPTAHVLFVGAWEDSELEQQLRKRADLASHRIAFQPPVTGDEKEELFQSASVLLFAPKWKEGHPRIVLEAICRGIPLVTTDRGTISETVNDGESAFVLDEPDPDQIAERVLQLLDDKDLHGRMRRAARARYEAEYTQDRADQQLAGWLATLAPA